MPIDSINGTNLYWEKTGSSGDSIILVHGGFVDHNHWGFLIPYLKDSYQVITYDRRGHSQSSRSTKPAKISDHVSDLASLISYLDLGSTHIVGHSFGALITLKLAEEQSNLIRSIVIQEPIIYGLDLESPAKDLVDKQYQNFFQVAELLESGQLEIGARLFVDSTLGPGVWHDLLENTRNLLVLNSQTFIDDMKNIEDANVNLSELTNSNKPTLLTRGEISPQFFQIFVDYLEQELDLGAVSIMGAGHSPHISHPGDYASVIKSFHFQYNQSIN